MAKQTQVSAAVARALSCAKEMRAAAAKLDTAKASMSAIMAKTFPNVAAYKNRPAYKAFFRALRTEDNKTTTAYMYARQWANEKFGGALSADGTIGKGSGKGMTLGRWNSAFKSQVNAISEYIGKVPSEHVEPAALELVTRMVEHVNAIAALEVEFDAYVEAEREAEALAKVAA